MPRPKTQRLPLVLLGLLLLAPTPSRAQRMGLWPSSGSGALPLARHDVDLSIHHPVVETTVTQEFENTQPFDLEATYEYPVPPGATVTGLCLWVNGERREARMMERQKAREIYDGIVQKKRDPAILERGEGGTFRLRVFPVLARSRTRVELRFAQPVESEPGGRYSVTLRRPAGETIHTLRLGLRLSAPLPVGGLELTGHAGGVERVGGVLLLRRPARASSFTQDIRLSYLPAEGGWSLLPAAAAVTRGEDRFVVAELPVGASTASRGALVLLVDRSSSMGRHLPAVADFVDTLLARVPEDQPAAVVTFGLLPDQPFRMSRLDAATRKRLGGVVRDLRPQGGTAYLPAVEAAILAGARHIVLVTDGGSRYHQAELEQVLRLLFDHPWVVLSVVTPPGAPNLDATQDLSRVSGGLHQALRAGQDMTALARDLVRLPGRERLELLDGRGEILPISRGTLRLLVGLRLPAGTTKATVRQGDRVWALDLPAEEEQAAGAGALYAAAAIDKLMQRIKLFGEEPSLREAVVKLSTSHHVLSEYTALLATEKDCDYDRPTSGRKWQRQATHFSDDLPASSFHSTPEPHEVFLLGLVLLALLAARRRGLLSSR